MESDPVAMWTKLESHHRKQRPAARFMAYDQLFSIRKREEESLSSLMVRVDDAMRTIQNLRSSGFTLENLEEELLCMAMIRALPIPEYQPFISSLNILSEFNKAKLQEAFSMEEATRQSRAVVDPVLAQRTSTPTTSSPSASTSTNCEFCGRRGHVMANCFKFKAHRTAAQEEVKQDMRKRGGKGQTSANQTQETNTTTAPVTEFAGNACLSSVSETGSDWCADSGASSHMTPHRHFFTSYTPFETPIRLADGNIIYSAGIGSVRFQPVIKGKLGRLLEIERVLHVPALRSNLLSVLYLVRKKAFYVTLHCNTIYFRLARQLVFTATIKENNCGYLDGHTVLPKSLSAMSASTCPLDITLWHRRFAHLNVDSVKRIIRDDLVTGLVIKSSTAPDPICAPCLAGKQHRGPIPKTATRATGLLDLIHSDVHGPLPVQSRTGHFRYWISFIDDKSRFWAIAPIQCKSDAFDAFKRFKVFAENQTGCKIKRLRDDKGGEYMSTEFNNFLADAGILREHTIRNEPHQNGVAERANRTLAEGITAALVESHLPASFWNDALGAYVHIHNRSPTAALDSGTPYSHWYGRKPDVSHLRVFGCAAYVHLQKDQRTPKGLGSHTQHCVFIGYPAEFKGWTFINVTTKQVVVSNAATFDERYFPGLRLFNSPAAGPAPALPDLVDCPVKDTPGQVGVYVPATPADDDSDDDDVPVAPPPVQLPVLPIAPPTPPPASPPPPPTPPIAQRRLKRNAAPPQRLIGGTWRNPTPIVQESDDDDSPDELDVISDQEQIPIFGDDPAADGVKAEEEALHAGLGHAFVGLGDTTQTLSIADAFEFAFKISSTHSSHAGDPETFAQAMRRPDADHWFKAAEDEMQSLLENGTWELVKLPPGRQAIGSRWVFRVKRNSDGSIERYKGRVVAQGFSQRPGFDYTETFAPTAKWAALRAILAVAALEDLELESVDISSAFLNGTTDADVYMRQPPGFEQGGPEWVCKLRKALYGLKQAGRQWHIKLDQEFTGMGFSLVRCDHSIWVWKRGDQRILVPVFVDDLTIAARNKADVEKVKSELRQRFKLRDLGPTSFLLGVHIIRDRSQRKLTMSQRQYTLDMLERYGMSDCSPVTTPMNPSVKLSTSDSPSTPDQVTAMKDIPYINAVGSLMYLAVATRPDIAYAVGVLCRFNSNPGPAHWTAVKHLFRYLKGTLDMKLVYAPSPDSTHLFTSYSDADHGANPDNGRSTTGSVIKMGTGAISWASKLQSIVTLSTTEAEYVAAVTTAQEILWLCNLFTEFGYSFNDASPLFVDNQSAISVAKNPEHHGRMKHLDLRFYWLRDVVKSKAISITYVPTADMPADILTKPLGRLKVAAARTLLGLEL
jgi:hypothetical protein